MISTIVRNAMWLGSGEAAVKGGLLLAVMLLARATGPAGVGTFSIAFAAAVIAVMVLSFGQQEVLIREVARAPVQAGGLLESARSVQRRIAMWLVPLAVAVIVPATGGDLRLTLLAFVPYAVLRTATVIRGAAFKGLDRMDMEARARAFEVGTAVLLIAATSRGGGPVWTAGLAFSVGSAVGLVWLARRTRELGEPLEAPPWAILAREGLPFMMLAVAGQLLLNQDRFLLELFGVPRAEIGYWGAAGTVGWALVALPQLLSVALYPTLSRAAEARVPRFAVGLATAVAGAALGFAMCLVVRVLAAPLVRLAFGGDFGPASALLARLAWALPGAFAMMVMGAVFAAWREQRRALAVMVGAVALSAVLNALWIPALGVIASANAAIVTYTSAALVMVLVLAVVPARREVRP